MKINGFVKLIVFSILLFIFHYGVVKFLLPNLFVKGIYAIHLFLALITILIIWLIGRVIKTDYNNFGKAFIVSVVLKMLIAIIFLWPTIKSHSPNLKLYIVHFFMVFFIYLFVEVKMLISTINK